MSQVGRPSDYTQELADRICGELALGKSMRKVCEAEDLPHVRTIFKWLRTNDEFRQQYETAKDEAADLFAEEIIEIADDSSGDRDEDGKSQKEYVQRSRLRVDARKWVASKLKPKKYGDKTQTEVSGPDGGPIPILPFRFQD